MIQLFIYFSLLGLPLLPCSLTLALSSSLCLVLPLVRGLFLPVGDQLAGGEKLHLSCAGVGVKNKGLIYESSQVGFLDSLAVRILGGRIGIDYTSLRTLQSNALEQNQPKF